MALRLRNKLPATAPEAASSVPSVPGAVVGTVTKLMPERGFGFITTGDRRNFFFHVSDTVGIAWEAVKCGLTVVFQVAAEPSQDRAGKSIKIRHYEVSLQAA